MVQIARPTSDVSVANMFGTPINTSGNLYQNIDEATASDTDYVYGAVSTAVTYECDTNTVLSPGSINTGHVVHYRLAKVDDTGTVNDTGSTQEGTVSIYQGATLISTDVPRTLTGTWTAYEWTLTGAEADAITDYSLIRFRIDSANSGGAPANRRAAACSWVEIEIPDPPIPAIRPKAGMFAAGY